jgi:hypothetical protein
VADAMSRRSQQIADLHSISVV